MAITITNFGESPFVYPEGGEIMSESNINEAITSNIIGSLTGNVMSSAAVCGSGFSYTDITSKLDNSLKEVKGDVECSKEITEFNKDEVTKLLTRIEALESVLAAVLPDFNKDNIAEWLEIKRNQDLEYLSYQLLQLKPVINFADIINKPTILAGYGITEFDPLLTKPITISASIAESTTYQNNASMPCHNLNISLNYGTQNTYATVKLPVSFIQTKTIY
jgi:hypothetical protein